MREVMRWHADPALVGLRIEGRSWSASEVVTSRAKEQGHYRVPSFLLAAVEQLRRTCN